MMKPEPVAVLGRSIAALTCDLSPELSAPGFGGRMVAIPTTADYTLATMSAIGLCRAPAQAFLDATEPATAQPSTAGR